MLGGTNTPSKKTLAVEYSVMEPRSRNTRQPCTRAAQALRKRIIRAGTLLYMDPIAIPELAKPPATWSASTIQPSAGEFTRKKIPAVAITRAATLSRAGRRMSSNPW
jgi:hypothetical protein